jgi:hypothetical protein
VASVLSITEYRNGGSLLSARRNKIAKANNQIAPTLTPTAEVGNAVTLAIEAADRDES